MRQVIEQSKDGSITMEIEVVFVVRGGKGKIDMQYHTPIDATMEFGRRAVCHVPGSTSGLSTNPPPHMG